MQNTFISEISVDFDDIVATFSDKRIASYNASDYKKAVRLYQINLMLCEALYPSLHCLEIKKEIFFSIISFR